MNPILITILVGLIGTAGMSVILWGITHSGVANSAMIRAIGSLFTKSYDDSSAPGLIIHFIVGIIVAFVCVSW
jgi:hypothetical protein